VSGGDAFDLATIGIDSVRWIRITDVTRIILDNRSHPFYDPTLSGFDLDAIIAVHTVPMAFEQRIESTSTTNEITVDVVSSATLSLYDVRGAVIYQRVLGSGIHNVDLSVVPRGAVIAVVDDGRTRQSLKVKR
jgi:ribosomal protein L31